MNPAVVDVDKKTEWPREDENRKLLVENQKMNCVLFPQIFRLEECYWLGVGGVSMHPSHSDHFVTITFIVSVCMILCVGVMKRIG